MKERQFMEFWADDQWSERPTTFMSLVGLSPNNLPKIHFSLMGYVSDVQLRIHSWMKMAEIQPVYGQLKWSKDLISAERHI